MADDAGKGFYPMAGKRIGVLLASANTTIEREFRTLAGDGTSIHATRLAHRSLSRETVERMRYDAVAGAELLADAEVDCIVYGITAGSFLLGANHDRDLVADIMSTTGIKAMTVLQGVFAKLETMRIERLALACPYVDEVTEREARFLTAAGYSVTAAGLGYSGVAEIGHLEPSSAIEVAHTALDRGADALFLSCTNWHTLPIIDDLEKALSIPVFSSNTAAFDLATGTL
jgi:maleate isomerase